ncbi:hypothetical protein SAMN05216188_102489 [Lentzea xinjiangensis]|uniref:Uncharacterized protein n=1 Tax=Lentzea xinjiangensis TaxID=402600 RepID=A0A1H9EBR7_9PSEU|nr:hypothetical protein SAMN05216188_102489 [Lentzea xinjiangensis]
MPSDIGSAGIARVTSGYGLTSRTDVLRRVDVPAVPGAASRARPMPGGELQLGEQVPAGGAGLAGGVPAVDHDQATACSFALVLRLSPELAPAGVGKGAGEASVAHRALDVEVLDHDHVSRPHERGTGAVQEVVPSVADLAMSTGDLGLRLEPVVAAASTARQPALVAGQVSGLAVQKTRVGHPRSVARHQEARQPEADTDHVVRGPESSRVAHVHSERHAPTTVGFSGDNDHRRVQLAGIHAVEGPGELQRCARPGQDQRTTSHPERRSRVVRALFAGSGLGPRVAGLPGKEVLERRVLVTQRLLQRHTGHFRQETEIVATPPRGQRGVRFPARSSCAFRVVTPSSFAQRLVPHETHAAESAGKDRGLLRSRVSTAFAGRSHEEQSTGIGMTRWTRASVREAL